MAILTRTVAYKNCGPIQTDEDTIIIGIDDNKKQAYNPQRLDKFPADKLAIYQQAIDETAGIYLTCKRNEM